MADIISLKKPEPLVLVCGECDNRSFLIYSESDEIECVGCGNRTLWNMQFVTEGAPKDPEKTDEGTKVTEYHCFGRTHFLNKLLKRAKTDGHDEEMLAVGVVSRSGVISCWRSDDIAEEPTEEMKDWIKKRWMSLLQLLLTP